MNTLLVYGAGDKGTQELLGKLYEMGIDSEFCDTRAKKSESVENLSFLLSHNFTTIPQVFHKDMTYIGNYEETLAYVERIPVNKRKPPPAPVDPPKSYA